MPVCIARQQLKKRRSLGNGNAGQIGHGVLSLRNPLARRFLGASMIGVIGLARSPCQARGWIARREPDMLDYFPSQTHSSGRGIMAGRIETRLAELKIDLPKAAVPVANYVPVVTVGNLAFVSGQVTIWNGEFRYKGRLGQEFKVEDGQAAARLCVLNVIAQLKNALGDLDRVKRCAKLTG